MKYDQEMWCRECKKVKLCRFEPSPDAGLFWRCSECGDIVEERVIKVTEEFIQNILEEENYMGGRVFVDSDNHTVEVMNPQFITAHVGDYIVVYKKTIDIVEGNIIEGGKCEEI